MTQREKLIELIETRTLGLFTDSVCEMLADYLIDNGVIALPCKAGDTVYAIWYGYSETPKILEDKVNFFIVDKYGICVDTDHIELGILGETVFLTREEAEAKIRSRHE